MNKVYIDEVTEISSGKPLYWEIREARDPYAGLYYHPFNLKIKTKEEALTLRDIINNNINANYPLVIIKQIE